MATEDWIAPYAKLKPRQIYGIAGVLAGIIFTVRAFTGYETVEWREVLLGAAGFAFAFYQFRKYKTERVKKP